MEMSWSVLCAIRNFAKESKDLRKSVGNECRKHEKLNWDVSINNNLKQLFNKLTSN